MDDRKKDIETERLLLRQMRETDIDDFLEYFTDPSVAFLGGYKTTGKSVASVIFRSNCLAGYTWAVVLKEENKVIGDVHFGNIIDGYLAHIGYIFNQKYWGNGYATEAVSAIVNFGFECLGFCRVRAITQKNNIKSQNLLKRCGFDMEALICDGDFNGIIDDIYYYSKKKYAK